MPDMVLEGFVNAPPVFPDLAFPKEEEPFLFGVDNFLCD